MNGCLSLWLGQESHTEGPKVSPEQEVEGVEGVCPPCSMLYVVLATKLSVRGKLHPTVIEKPIWVDLSIILRYGEREKPTMREGGVIGSVSLGTTQTGHILP